MYKIFHNILAKSLKYAFLNINTITIIFIFKEVSMPFAQKVKSALWVIVDIMALHSDRLVKNPGKDFSRERKLGFVQMIRLYICMESGCICHELLKYFFFNPDESPSAFDFITDCMLEYRMRLWVVRFQIKEGVYENIITNLPDRDFPAEQIKYIYQLRWGIETSFRDLKHTIGTANFHSKSPEYIEFEIICRMILYNFATIVTMEDAPEKKKKEKWE